jgi:hypothetical protein
VAAFDLYSAFDIKDIISQLLKIKRYDNLAKLIGTKEDLKRVTSKIILKPPGT